MRLEIVVLVLAATPAQLAAEAPVRIVACAPGYPGTASEAQPAMDAFAVAVAKEAGLALGQIQASYAPTEKEGLALLADASVAIVPVPFFVKNGVSLGLTPRLWVEQKGLGPTERWTLVAKKGRVTKAADLAGLTVVSIAGYAPKFVRAVLGPDWRMPESTQVTESSQVLSALRRVVQGDSVAVLLDGAQGNALPTLPFAGELDVVARSAPLPAAMVATVGKRPGTARWAPLEKALLALPNQASGATALDGIRIVRFQPTDSAALDAIRQFSGPAR
jgi:hypothetical protein